MNLSALQFRDRMGKRISPSVAETRGELSTAELCHVVDIGKSVWCRPCQSTECRHAERVEHALRAAGFGAGAVSNARELPRIARITRYGAMGETIAGCWFENSARLRYHEQHDGHVSRVVFAPEKPQTPAATSPQPDAESAEVRLVEMLSEYSEYRRNGDLDGFQRDHPELAIVAGGDEDEDFRRAYRENAEHAREINQEWQHVSREANQYLGDAPDPEIDAEDE